MSEREDQIKVAVCDTVDLLERLSYHYETPEECLTWFKSPQPLLDGALPIDLIAQGRAIGLVRRSYG